MKEVLEYLYANYELNELGFSEKEKNKVLAVYSIRFELSKFQ